MNHPNNQTSTFELIYIIVNFGLGSKVLKLAKKNGIKGGTVVIGKGTVKHDLLNFFSLYDKRKEIVMIGSDSVTANIVIDKVYKHFKMNKPNHGIIFTIKMNQVVGSSQYQKPVKPIKRSEKHMEYQVIVTIVNRGSAQDVIEVANEAGSRGGTIINARGSGTHETSKIFNMEIEPEKEMVMILSRKDITDKIVENIRVKLELDKPGKGILFIQDVHQAYGIYEEKTKEA
ncbi:MAG: P-II family nitrogen regulator [Acholeplasmataceae bacterium]